MLPGRPGGQPRPATSWTGRCGGEAKGGASASAGWWRAGFRPGRDPSDRLRRRGRANLALGRSRSGQPSVCVPLARPSSAGFTARTASAGPVLDRGRLGATGVSVPSAPVRARSRPRAGPRPRPVAARTCRRGGVALGWSGAASGLRLGRFPSAGFSNRTPWFFLHAPWPTGGSPKPGRMDFRWVLAARYARGHLRAAGSRRAASQS